MAVLVADEASRPARPWRGRAVADRLAVGGALLGTWHLTSVVVDPYVLPSPAATLTAFAALVRSGAFAREAVWTLVTTGTGFAVGAVLGTALAFMLRRLPGVTAILEPFVQAGYALPKVALAPLLAIWVGVGPWPKIGLVALAVFFIAYVHARAGVRAVDDSLMRLAQLWGADERTIARHVVLPSALPLLLSGYRLALSYAAATAVVAEIATGDRGIGYLLQLAATNFDAAGVFGALIGLGAVLGAVMLAMLALERACLRWRAPEPLALGGVE